MDYEFRDRLTQPLYDTVRIAANTTLDLFRVPVGQGETVFGLGPKHFGDTNMYLSGQTPAGWTFMLRSIYLELVDSPDIGMGGASLELRIGSKSYLTIPWSRARVSLTISPTTTIAAMNAVAMLKQIHPAAVPMLLGSIPGIAIGFDLEDRKLCIGGATVFGLSLRCPLDARDGAIVRAYLNGELQRPVQ